MAHADHEWVREISSKIRIIGKRLNREPAIMMDVKGPEIRTGYLQDDVELKKDDLLDLVFVAQPVPPTKEGIWQIEVNYDRLADHIKSGDTVLIDNGLIIDNLHGVLGIDELSRIVAQLITIFIIVAIINAINIA